MKGQTGPKGPRDAPLKPAAQPLTSHKELKASPTSALSTGAQHLPGIVFVFFAYFVVEITLYLCGGCVIISV